MTPGVAIVQRVQISFVFRKHLRPAGPEALTSSNRPPVCVQCVRCRWHRL